MGYEKRLFPKIVLPETGNQDDQASASAASQPHVVAGISETIWIGVPQLHLIGIVKCYNDKTE